MSLKLSLTLALLTALCACDRSSSPKSPEAAAPSAASDETGVVTGIVRLDGEVPAPAQLPTNAAVRRRCGEAVTDPSLVVGAAGALRGAIVSLVDAPATTSTPPKDVLLDQKGCVFIPSVIAAQAGATLVIKNSDPLTHNVRAIQEKGDLFNVAMPLEGMTMKRVLPAEPGLVQLHCDIHPWMNGVLKTYAHPHFGQTDAEGRFRIEGAPAGRHTFEIWHPRLPPRRIELTVPPRGEVTREVRFSTTELTPAGAGVGATGPL